MQRIRWIILWPLFLILLSAVSSVCYCHSDFGNSVLLNSVTARSSVMASEMRCKRGKRLLQQHDPEIFDAEVLMQPMHNDQRFHPSVVETESIGFAVQQVHQPQSRRSRHSKQVLCFCLRRQTSLRVLNM